MKIDVLLLFANCMSNGILIQCCLLVAQYQLWKDRWVDIFCVRESEKPNDMVYRTTVIGCL